MSDGDASARRRRAALAGHTGDHEAAFAALDDAAPRVREAALRSLARLERLDTAVLATALEDPDPRLRTAALELAATRDEPPIIHVLDDPDPRVVEMAAWACGERQPVAGVVDRLSAMSADHPDALVREAAVAALGALGDDAGLPAILAAMVDKPAVRRRAVIALAAFEGPEVDAAWARARDDRDRQVRDAVDELLGPAD